MTVCVLCKHLDYYYQLPKNYIAEDTFFTYVCRLCFKKNIVKELFSLRGFNGCHKLPSAWQRHFAYLKIEHKECVEFKGQGGKDLWSDLCWCASEELKKIHKNTHYGIY